MMQVRVQNVAFDFAQEAKNFAISVQDCGALVTFTGIVRNNDAGDLLALEIEHYPAMTRSALENIAGQAMEKWSLADCLIIHRFGHLTRGEPIMMVATAAPHRAAAFASADFMMDYLKSRAPFWKKEVTYAGAEWVAAKYSDEQALSRW